MSERQNLEEGLRWLGQARDDLRFAVVGLREGFYAQTCFISQQAAEKGLKALRYARGDRRVLGHSLVRLLQSLRDEIPNPDELRSAAAELDLHYVPARYPNGLPDLAPYQTYTKEQAERALEHARRIVATAAERLDPPRP